MSTVYYYSCLLTVYYYSCLHSCLHVYFSYIFITQAGIVGKQGVAAPVSIRLVCQPCFICQLLHHCVNASRSCYNIAPHLLHTRL
jgi:hypothetical protein